MPNIALLQTFCSEDPEDNLNRSELQIERAASMGAEIVLLQELFTTRYFCRETDPVHFEQAEPIPGPVTNRLCMLAAGLNVVIVAPLFERCVAGLYYNSLVVIDADGSLLGRYRKMHIPDDPGFHEKYYFTPGDTGYRVFETTFGKIGTLICWDQWFPEAARITAMRGAELLVYPTAIATLPEEGEQEKRRFLKAWQLIQSSHAIANSCFVAAVNRVGREGELDFWGHSFLAGPFGEMLGEAGEEEQILVVGADFNQIEKQRLSWPFFRDRRIDSYGPILQRWNETPLLE